MPRLGSHYVVKNRNFLLLAGDSVVDFGVPFAGQKFYSVLKKQIEIVLVLRYYEIVHAEQFAEFFENVAFAVTRGVYKQDSGVEISVSVYSENLFDVRAESLVVRHYALVHGAGVHSVDIGIEKLRNILFHHRVAVDINNLVVLGEHIGDKQAVVRGFGVVIANGQVARKFFKIGRNVVEGNVAIVGFHGQNFFSVFVGYGGNEKMNVVTTRFIAIIEKRTKRHCRERNEIIVAGIKNGNRSVFTIGRLIFFDCFHFVSSNNFL